MKITVRACVLAAVVLVLGASSMFAQSIDSGAPAGSVYNGGSAYNFAVNREGVRELFAPITVCMPGPAAAGTGWGTGDTFRVRYVGAGAALNSSPVIVSGALTVGTQITAFQTTASSPTLSATANATVVTIPGIGGGVPTTVSEVDVTITQGITSGYPACITLSNLRFDVANAVVVAPATGATSAVPVNSAFVGTADLMSSFGVAGPVAVGAGLPAGVLSTGMPASAAACPVVIAPNAGCLVGTSGATISTAAIAIVGGTTQGPTGATFTKTGGSIVTGGPTGVGGGRANPGYLTNGVALTTNVPSLVQNSGATGTAVISVLQNGLPPVTAGIAATTVNIDTRSGGGMLRSNASSGANAASWLISSGATTGSQIEFAVAGMPTGSSVTFGTDASVTGSSGELMHMTLVGSGVITAPSGKATYVVTNNVTGGSATQIDVPYSVTVAGTGSVPGSASVIISVRPAATAGDIPRYIESSTGATGLTVTPNPTNTAVSALFSFALYNIAPSTSTRVYPYLLLFGTVGQAASYDTGIVLCNTTGALSPTGVFSPTVANGSQTGTFAFDLFPAKDTGGAPIHLTSDISGFPGGPTLGAGGVLAPGNCWQALLSEVLKAANVSGNWKGYGRITTAWNVSSTGFTFISQFANAGGSTMGYLAQ